MSDLCPRPLTNNPSHLREVPRLLLQAGHLFTVEQLREAADLIVHHAASVVPGAAQRAQEKLPVFGVASQLRGFEGASHGSGQRARKTKVRQQRRSTGSCIRTLSIIFVQVVPILYLRTPTMAGVQGGRVVLLYTLIHAQVAHFRVTNLS